MEFIARSCTREPYVKLTPVTHRKVLNLFVAIPRDFSERADFTRCTLWGKGADLAVDVKRNDYIKVTGRLMSRDVYVNDEDMKPDVIGGDLRFWDLKKMYFDEGKKDLLNQWADKIRFGGTNN